MCRNTIPHALFSVVLALICLGSHALAQSDESVRIDTRAVLQQPDPAAQRTAEGAAAVAQPALRLSDASQEVLLRFAQQFQAPHPRMTDLDRLEWLTKHKNPGQSLLSSGTDAILLRKAIKEANLQAETIIDSAERSYVQGYLELAGELSLYRFSPDMQVNLQAHSEIYVTLQQLGYKPGRYEELAERFSHLPAVKVENARRAYGKDCHVEIPTADGRGTVIGFSRERARIAYQTALAICKEHPDSPEAHLHAMHLCVHIADWPQARAHALEALKHFNNHLPGRFAGTKPIQKIGAALALQQFVERSPELAEQLAPLLQDGVPAWIAQHDPALIARVRELLLDPQNRLSFHSVLPH